MKKSYENAFNKYTIIFIISPLFAIAWLFENYIVAGLVLIISAVSCLIIRKLRYQILTPFLVLIFYYIIVNIFVPGTINAYDYMISIVNVYIVVGIIIFFLILGLFFITKLPDLKLTKNIVISPVSILGYGLASVLIILVLLPIVNLLTSEDWGTLAHTFQNKNVANAIGLSVLMALFATLASLIFGLPLGYVLARKEFAGKSVIQGVVDVPIVIPHTVAGIALLTVFGAQGIIGAPLDDLGVKFVDAWPGIVVAMMFVSFPFVVNSARDGFQAIDPRMENVARSLGATRVNTFTKVLLPLSYKNIVTGSIMCWARAISEFGAVIILVYFPMIAPTLIYDRFTSFGLDASSPIAVLLVLICLVVFIILRFLTGLKPRALRSSNNRFG